MTATLDRRRILVVAPQPFYEDRGTPIAVGLVVEALSQLGYWVDVLTLPVGRSLEIPRVRYFRIPNPLGIRSVPIGFSFRKLWFDVFLLMALRRRLRERRYLCIHAVEEAVFLAVVAARRSGTPVVYDMQSSLSEQMGSKRLLNNRPARAVLHACERWALRKAAITVCSTGLAARAHLSMRGGRVEEWQYPVSVRPVPRDQVAQLRIALGLGPDQPTVVYTGNFEEYQGLPAVVAAIPDVLLRVPRAVFVFVGATEPGWGKRLARQLPEGAYRVLNRRSRDQLAGFLAMADIVVSPRVQGGNLPLKVLDYLAAGCAIVATSIPAHRAVLNEELAVLAEPTSAGLAAAITDLLQDPAKATRLRIAARAYAERHHGWTDFLRSVGQRYEQLKLDA